MELLKALDPMLSRSFLIAAVLSVVLREGGRVTTSDKLKAQSQDKIEAKAIILLDVFIIDKILLSL